VADGGRAPAAASRIVPPDPAGPDGMPTRHPFTSEHYAALDPFLYFAEFGPRDIRATRWGFPPHPHRGFETVTYLLAGAVEHRDSFGARDILRAGDVQWMTAAAGIVHAEEAPAEFLRAGGVLHGFQIWVNLPAALKSIAPGYQMVRAADMPVRQPAPGVSVRAIGGALTDAASPVVLRWPAALWHATLAPGAAWTAPKPAGWTGFAWSFGAAETARLTVFDRAADALALVNRADAPMELIVGLGQPIGETIASYGPFVMNTRAELVQAVHDYQAGRMGEVQD
jgi:hypothetical protein